MIDSDLKDKYIQAIKEVEGFRKEWCDAHGAPMPRRIDCLDLIMKKEFALQILDGTKKIELRDASNHYCRRLYDSNITRFIDLHQNDDEIMNECGPYGYLDELMQVDRIHFHNYSNSWFLDVKVLHTDYLYMNNDVKDQLNTLGIHDVDDAIDEFEKKGIKPEERPVFFQFVLDEIIDTNLK